MRNKLATQAVVLKSVNIKDSDKIFTLFSKDVGRISARAYGVRKITSKRASNLDTLNLIKVSLSLTHDFYYLDEVEIISSFDGIKKDLDKIRQAYYLCELILKNITEEEKEPGIYDTFVKTLTRLNTAKSDYKIYVHNFEILFLEYLGYSLEISTCNRCNKDILSDEIVYYNVEERQAYCTKCSNFGMKISGNILGLIKSLKKSKIDLSVYKKHEVEIDRFLKSVLSTTFGKDYNSLDYF